MKNTNQCTYLKFIVKFAVKYSVIKHTEFSAKVGFRITIHRGKVNLKYPIPILYAETSEHRRTVQCAGTSQTE